uniref:Uncharacterized protein n=1 Tax=Acrobeloides nanus TaxID=290746 RepID=A0A914CPC4_9BILA
MLVALALQHACCKKMLEGKYTSFASRACNKNEACYPSYDLEWLAVMYGVIANVPTVSPNNIQHKIEMRSLSKMWKNGEFRFIITKQFNNLVQPQSMKPHRVNTPEKKLTESRKKVIAEESSNEKDEYSAVNPTSYSRDSFLLNDILGIKAILWKNEVQKVSYN